VGKRFAGYSMGNLIFDIKRNMDVKRTRAGIILGVLRRGKVKNPFDSCNSLMSIAYHKEKDKD